MNAPTFNLRRQRGRESASRSAWDELEANGGARSLGLAGLAVAFMLPAGCSGPLSTLDPAGPSAHDSALLWWWMFRYATLVLAAVVALWLYACWRRPREWSDAGAKLVIRRWIIGGGIILPLGSVAVLLAFGIPMGHRMLHLPTAGAAPLGIEAIGHRWQWEIRYPGVAAPAINELRLPVGRAVAIHTTSSDVIHSFWVPRLGGKVDAIPGRINVVRLEAREAGTFFGQCAEFCGLQHAHMKLVVHAMPQEQFDAWLRGQQGPATAMAEP